MFKHIKKYDFIIIESNLNPYRDPQILDNKPYFVISPNEHILGTITSFGERVKIFKNRCLNVKIVQFTDLSKREQQQFKITLNSEHFTANKLNYLLKD